MFRYKINVLEELNRKGFTSYKMRQEKLLNESAIQSLRENKIVGIKALEQICSMLNCQPNDIIEFVPNK